MPKICSIKSLKGAKRFSEVFGKGKKFSSSKLMLSIELGISEYEELNEVIEIGVVVGKRVSKKAVVRNRVKRLLRESIRVYLPILLGENNKISVKGMIINWRQPIDKPKLIRLADVSKELIYLLTRASNQLDKTSQDSQ